jgi:hypothetical protein
MIENTATAKPVVAISRIAARLAFAGAATFVVLLAALHVIKPRLDPSWHFISKYAIGRHGWIMVLAFLSLRPAGEWGARKFRAPVLKRLSPVW